MAGLNLKTRPDHIPTPDEAYAQLFGVKLQGGITNIKLCNLRPYPNQPFRLYGEEKLLELVEDIKTNGVLSPIIVRPIKETDGIEVYQILAGHNRSNACQLAGLQHIPAIIKDVDDATAALIVVNTNLNQRDKLLPSEKAFAYKIQHEANKSQGKRNDLTLDPMGRRLNTDIRPIGSEVESKTNIKRYIRLTYLISSFLSMVDSETLPFRAGVELSFLNGTDQELLYNYINKKSKKISLSQAEQIKEFCQENKLTNQVLNRIFEPAKPLATTIKINLSKLSRLIPEDQQDNAEDYIVKALEHYKNHIL